MYAVAGTVSSSCLTAVDFIVATYARTKRSSLAVSLIDDSGVEIHREVLPTSIFKNGSQGSIRFSPIQNSAGKEYVITFSSPDSSASDAVGLWASSADRYSTGQLYFGEDRVSGDLAIMAYYKR